MPRRSSERASPPAPSWLTRRGWLPIEELQVGDEVWSKPEGELGHVGGWKRVEELFVRSGRIWHLHVGGELIRTTGEHPFYVLGKGWTDACLLQPGDLLCSRDGSTVAVEEAYDTGEYETVYNCRVADYHTYFVGSEEWGFSVWAHNASCTWNEFQRETKGMWSSNKQAGRVWRALNNSSGKHYTGTAKPWTTGAKPNSMYTQVNASGQAVQTAIYNSRGKVIAHIDWKNHGGTATSGHWHVFPRAGNPASGHGPGKAHIPHNLQPPGFPGLPAGVSPVTPIGT